MSEITAAEKRENAELRAKLSEAEAALTDIKEGNFPWPLIERCAKSGNVMDLKDWLQNRAKTALAAMNGEASK